MSFWYDANKKEYASDGRNGWIKAYCIKLCNDLKEQMLNLVASLQETVQKHFDGAENRHTAEDIDYDAGETVKQRIEQEISDRQSGDNVLLGKINTETVDRTNADSDLQSQITDEIADRQSGDNVLIGKINTETADRTNADSDLQSQITAEITNRQTADNTLRTELNSEIANRENADTEIKDILGDKDSLATDIKTNFVSAINELKNSLDRTLKEDDLKAKFFNPNGYNLPLSVVSKNGSTINCKIDLSSAHVETKLFDISIFPLGEYSFSISTANNNHFNVYVEINVYKKTSQVFCMEGTTSFPTNIDVDGSIQFRVCDFEVIDADTDTPILDIYNGYEHESVDLRELIGYNLDNLKWEIGVTNGKVGDMQNLSTDVKTNLVEAINELKNSLFSGSYTDLTDTPTDATSTTSGLMSAADKVKLDSIVEGADIYTMPTASNLVLGGVKLSDSVTSTNNTGNGIAATPAAAKAAYDKAVEVGNTRIWNSSGVTAANANSWALSSYKLTMSGARNIALAYGYSYDTLVEMLGEGNLLAACGGVAEFNGATSAIIGGYGHKLNGIRSVILGGYNNIAHAYNAVCGKSCKEPTATDYNSNSGDLFVVGNGTASTRSNGFRVAANGNCYAGVAFNGTGADYNEVREWSDGNVDDDDRCGYMVAFDGIKIRLAQPGDNLRKVGIISGNSCITGNNFADYWHGKYKRDIYGRYETEPVHNDAEYDEDGNIIKEEYDGYSYVLSEDYDPSLEDEYIPRLDRSEYDLMATHGEVVVRDDGTCEADGYCIPGQDGIATKDNDEIGFYVMERVDENHIRVFVR